MTRDALIAALANVNVQAFLRVIREGESSQDTSAYTRLYGGGHFESFADHPRKHFPLPGGLTTSAAGAYQITETTWNALVKQFGFEDFSPTNQDQAAVALIAGRHALEPVFEGDLATAIRLLPQEWTSLGLAKRIAEAPEIFAAYGGGVPIEQPTGAEGAPQPQEVKPMLPILIPAILEAFGPQLVKLIPALGALFGSGSEVQQRNVSAITAVADAVVTATQSPNLQAAVEKMTADPSALQAGTEAAHDILPSLMEAGSGGMDGARKASQEAEGDWRKVVFSFPFLLCIFLLPLIYVVVFAALFKFPWLADFTAEMRMMVVTAIISLVLGSIIGFVYGTSIGSQKKDAALARAAS